MLQQLCYKLNYITIIDIFAERGFDNEKHRENTQPQQQQHCNRNSARYTCQLCANRVVSIYQLNHVVRHHFSKQQLGVGVFECVKCSFRSNHKRCVKDHLVRKHDVPKQSTDQYIGDRRLTDPQLQRKISTKFRECFGQLDNNKNKESTTVEISDG